MDKGYVNLRTHRGCGRGALPHVPALSGGVINLQRLCTRRHGTFELSPPRVRDDGHMLTMSFATKILVAKFRRPVSNWNN